MAVLALLLATAPAQGQDATGARWRIDPHASEIAFHLSALGVIPIEGRFLDFRGGAEPVPGEGRLRVRLVIDTGSLAMTSDRHADWARSSEFFDVRHHPRIEFTSAPLAPGALRAGSRIDGLLRLRGIERRAAFDIVESDCATGLPACTLTASGDINRLQFGMRSRRIALGSRVRLSLRLQVVADPS